MLSRKRDLVHSALSDIASDNREEANYMMRKQDSDSLYEIQIVKKNGVSLCLLQTVGPSRHTRPEGQKTSLRPKS